jgi:hypothetical protein
MDTNSNLGEIKQSQYEIKQSQQEQNYRITNIEINIETLESTVTKVIKDQNIINQAVESLSTAVSNRTTKKERAIMHSRIEHMIGQLICNKQDPQYTSSQIKFPPELQITFEDDSTMFDTGMAKANSLDGFNNHETTLTVLYPNKQHETSLGTGNHNNSRLSTMEGTHQPVRIYGTGYV